MVDKANPDFHVQATSKEVGAPGNEIEITPEMIRAGVIALERHRESYDDWGLVQAVYISMRRLEGRVPVSGMESQVPAHAKGGAR